MTIPGNELEGRLKAENRKSEAMKREMCASPILRGATWCEDELWSVSFYKKKWWFLAQMWELVKYVCLAQMWV